MTKTQKDKNGGTKVPNRGKSNTPRLRFSDFNKEWKLKNGNEIFDNISNKKHNSHLPILAITQEHGAIPREFIDYKISVTDKSIESYKVVNKGDFIISLRSFQGGIEYSEYDGICSPAYIILKPKIKIIDKFFKFYLKTPSYITSLNKNLEGIRDGKMISYKYFSEITLPFPTIEEQNKIAIFFDLIETRIQTQNKIIRELKVLKTTITKRIFSGQLRFKNASRDNYEDWKTKKLGDVTTLINKRNKNNEKLPVYSINNKLGFVPQSEQFEGVDSEDRGYDITLYKIIDKNTFAYNPARINVGSIGYSGNLENIIISSLYVCFKTEESVNDNFLFQYLKTDFFNKEVLRNVEGGVRDYLFYDNFARIKFDLPCIEEQKKIADCLSSIDMKIDIETQLLQKLEEQKKFLLQQMFV